MIPRASSRYTFSAFLVRIEHRRIAVLLGTAILRSTDYRRKGVNVERLG